ncbi:uncharacterized protein TNCV_437321 [Trichonephila clavipes]|nr:uncharacterized protein TNCV_437321 [Trichonephila clavipes]
MIERFHRHLKSAIIAHEDTGFTDILPIVLLGLRSAMNNYLKATSSQLVYSTTLRLTSDLISSESLQTSVTPTYVSKNHKSDTAAFGVSAVPTNVLQEIKPRSGPSVEQSEHEEKSHMGSTYAGLLMSHVTQLEWTSHHSLCPLLTITRTLLEVCRMTAWVE